jgi:hypothetical protein
MDNTPDPALAITDTLSPELKLNSNGIFDGITNPDEEAFVFVPNAR